MNDSVPTPDWLMKFFRQWHDPVPIGGTLGLVEDWKDPTFANIPYSCPMEFVEKAILESKNGIRVILMVRVNTSTKWWLRLVEHGARFAFFVGRIKFQGEGSPNFASAWVFL